MEDPVLDFSVFLMSRDYDFSNFSSINGNINSGKDNLFLV